MTTETVPVPAQVMPEVSSSSPASEVKTAESVEQSTPPQAQGSEPAGNEQQSTPEPAKALESKPEEKGQTEAESRRKQRNQERWRNLSNAARERDLLRAELELLKPKSVDYSQITDPDEALAERTAEKLSERQRASTVERLKHAEHRQAEAMFTAWDEIKAEARERIPDFDTVVNDRTPIHARMAPLIVESENGADIAYWLGKNPDAARNLFNQFETAPQRALIELGRIEARLSAPPPPPVTKAPAPAPVLNGGQNPIQFDAKRASVDDMTAYLKSKGVIT